MKTLKDFLSGINNEPSSKRLVMFMVVVFMFIAATVQIISGKTLIQFMWDSFYYIVLVCLGVIGLTNVADLLKKKE